MKTPATRFEIQINGKRFSDATVNLEDQLEVNLVTVPGQDSAVLALTAFVPQAGTGGHYVRSENAVLGAGDSLTITLSAADGVAATSVGRPDEELEEDPEDVGTMTCSFCGKNQHDVGKLVSGVYASICDECVVFCQQVINDEK